MFTFIWGRLLEDVGDMFKSPKLQQNPMHHCLQGIYLDHRRIERILLSHTEPMTFDISCSLARPCQVFFDWRHWVIWRVGQGLQKRKTQWLLLRASMDWIWTTSMSGLLGWNPATIGFDPNLFTSKAPNWPKKRSLWISELIRAFVVFSALKKQVPSPIYYPRLDWNPSYLYLMGDFITYIISIYIYTHYRTQSFDCLSSLEMSWGGVDADSDASSAHHTMLPVWLRAWRSWHQPWNSFSQQRTAAMNEGLMGNAVEQCKIKRWKQKCGTESSYVKFIECLYFWQLKEFTFDSSCRVFFLGGGFLWRLPSGRKWGSARTPEDLSCHSSLRKRAMSWCQNKSSSF